MMMMMILLLLLLLIIRSSRVVLVFESAGRTGFPIPVGVKDFLSSAKVRTGSGAQTTYYSVVAGDPSKK
jgi:hypothetical protein